MRLTDLFWLFLIFSALQPFIRQKWLEASRLWLSNIDHRRAVGTRISMAPEADEPTPPACARIVPRRL